MILRFRTKDGLFRVNVNGHDQFEKALHGLANQLPGPVTDVVISTTPSGDGEPAEKFTGKTVDDMQLKHGDMLFLTYTSKNEGVDEDRPSGPTEVSHDTAQTIFKNVKQSPLDDELDRDPGKIIRPKDPKMCRHGDKGMCEFCMPLEPYDLGYQEQNSIKHLSFHAFLKKLNADANKTGSSSSYISPVAEPFYGVAKKCPSGHAPWPAGICSKCQPSAITLQQQSFRMVDHVEFAHSSIVNTFLDAWRRTGTQRIGYLYGTYERYNAVPLGIKAVVQAIYEPPQSDEVDGVTLTLPWPEKESIDRMAQLMGLEELGVIFTDLIDAGMGDGSVLCKRHADSYFLSSQEVVFAATLQNQKPNACRWSSTDGQFSSKYVTCVVSGNTQGQIDVSCYQVSTSAEAMVSADLIEPSVNPSVMRVKEPSSTRYVPDIFYKRMNEYRLAVQENAKPAFPVEYLLVTLTHGFPDQPNPMFGSTESQFPVENRAHMGLSQDLNSLKQILGSELSLTNDIAAIGIKDFHILAYVMGLGILGEDECKQLAIAVKTGDINQLYIMNETGGWKTLQMIANS